MNHGGIVATVLGRPNNCPRNAQYRMGRALEAD
jgi:hypothetical protein